MYGRYGSDQLYKALFGLAFAALIINIFVKSSVMNGFVLLLLVVANYRVFSRNIYKRQVENSYYLKKIKVVKKELNLNIRRVKEVKLYRFRKCPNCGQVLRLKRVKGKHKTVCPKCHAVVSVTIII